MTELNCSVCGRNMVDPETGTSIIGVSMSITDDVTARIYPELANSRFDVCYVCWLRSMGVRMTAAESSVSGDN